MCKGEGEAGQGCWKGGIRWVLRSLATQTMLGWQPLLIPTLSNELDAKTLRVLPNQRGTGDVLQFITQLLSALLSHRDLPGAVSRAELAVLLASRVPCQHSVWVRSTQSQNL